MTRQQANKAKARVNEKLHALGCMYHDGIPMTTICGTLEMEGFDTESLNAIYCGSEGREHSPVGNGVYLTMSWYKFDATGRYEVVAYVS